MRARWDNIINDAGVPANPDHLSDQQVVDLYFKHRGELESRTSSTPTPWTAADQLSHGSSRNRAAYGLTSPPGRWPGSDVVDMLTDWFTAVGFICPHPRIPPHH